MSEAKLKKQLSKADGIVVRRLLLSDVESVVSCFQRCYGGTYPVDGFSNPELLRELITQERLHSVVAVTGDGTVVGHMGLRSRTPDARTAEAGNTVVDPRYRGHHLSTRLGIALTVLATEHGLVGTHGYPTTAHPVIQKLEVAGGGIECGVLLDYIPAETEYVGLATAPARQRLAVVVIYRPLSVAPARRVWLPRRHRALAESL